MKDLKALSAKIYQAMTVPEKILLGMLALFGLKFLFSTLAHKVTSLQALDLIGSGRNPVDVWLLLFGLAGWLGLFCLYRRAIKAVGIRLGRFEWLVLGALCLANMAFYYLRVSPRSTIYYWDYATYYQLQVRMESNFAEGVFNGLGATIFKTWFNDYAPLIICTLLEPIFMFTDRMANTFAMIGGMVLPLPVYLSAAVLLARLRQLLGLGESRVFYGLGLLTTALFPLLHSALYSGMPDMLGVAWGLMLLALLADYDFGQPDFVRLASMTAFTGILMVTRRCYMFTVIVLFLLYAVWTAGNAVIKRNWQAVRRLVCFGAVSLACVGLPLAPLFWRLTHTDYADIYAAYMSGGLTWELNNQVGYLGWVLLALILCGTAAGFRQKPTSFLALCVPVAPLCIVLLITRVQNMSVHQSLAMVPFYLLGLYLCLGAVCGLNRRTMRVVLCLIWSALILWNGGVNGLLPVRLPSVGRMFSSAALREPTHRKDLDEILAVGNWLSETYPGYHTAYMLCHNSKYSPDIFRTVVLPNETLRDILPYGAADAGNDGFPTELFTAEVVLTTGPEDNAAYRADLAGAFEQVRQKTGSFELEREFPLDGTTLYAYRRIAPCTAGEIEQYRTLLADWDEKYPQNFGAVFDRCLQEITE